MVLGFQTFEGHDCAVLKVTFVTRGMQLLSRYVGMVIHILKTGYYIL